MLIIWDFDGVICDSDDIWAENWRKLLKSEKGIEISEQEKRELLIGISEKDKAKRLESHFSGLKIDDAFKKKLNELHDFGMKNLLVLTNGVDKIFADSRFKQCIATGGNQYQNDTKNHTVGIDKYFSKNNCFTVDMVEKGKPNPDIFLLAAEKMQVSASDCIIIEDSLEGIRGGKNAGMKVFAFCGAKANNNPEYKHKCLLVGADKVFDNMEHLHTELVKLQN
ncbi:MAG: HAD family phosphatase [Alphaproteobacteria bacterium]